MAAYAGLVSLQQTVAAILDGGGGLFNNIHNKPQLQSLHEKVTFLVDFLRDSCPHSPNQILSAALETNMRDAAYRAENLIQARNSAISGSDARRLRVLTANTVFNFFFFFLVFSNNRIPLRFPEAVPEPIEAVVLVALIPALASAAACCVCGVGLYLVLGANNFLDLNDPRAPLARELFGVLRDLSSVVDRIKEARGRDGDQEASVHAALLSLRKVIDSVIEFSDNGSQLESLREKVTFLLDFRSNASYTQLMTSTEVESTEEATREAIYTARQVVERQIPAQISLESDRKSLRRLIKLMVLALMSSVSALATARMPFPFQLVGGWVIIVIFGFGVLALGTSRSEVLAAMNINPAQENRDLCLVLDDLSTIEQNVKRITSLPALSSSLFRRESGGSNVVGLERDITEIKERLIRQNCSHLDEVVSIVGMGGIGKTTLATQVYNDADVACFFDIRAWATVSQEYSFHRVLLALLDSAKILTPQRKDAYDDEILALILYRDLVNRRYLVVIDDVWDTKIWDFLRRYLPENRNGSRIVLTSQIRDVANHSSSGSSRGPHEMKCLNEEQSWRLLREKVFGEDGSCPSELESIGKKIARGCGGLPLAILVIGGVLSKEEKHRIIWEDVAQEEKIARGCGGLPLKSGKIKKQCLATLGLSYKHLPHHLRPCFLYFGVFLGDSEISVSRLINLWIAEGFLKPRAAKSLEEEAEDYLKDLIDRNLILVRAKSCNGRIKTCGIHDLLRDFCVETARKENFFRVTDGGGESISIDRERSHRATRRLSIRPDASRDNDSYGSMSCYFNLRSLLCTSTASNLLHSQPRLYLGFMYLRVLDVLALHFGEFPDQIVGLDCLRYLAFHCDAPLPSSMSNLRKIETIVYHHCSSKQCTFLPWVIWWSMPSLRYLYVKPGLYFSDPLRFNPFRWTIPVLKHLHTLVGIRNFKWSKDIITRIPNLRKLGISYRVSSFVDWSIYELESLADLHQLENLKIVMEYDNGASSIPPELAFPKKLKKLSLSGCGVPWGSVGPLPNLEALKLRNGACSGQSWGTVEGEFPKLKYLLLENIGFTLWKAEEDHFPSLQRLVVRKCRMLEEIPSGIGDISTLETIEVDDCHPLAVASAKNMKQEQEEMGNELRVLIKEREEKMEFS